MAISDSLLLIIAFVAALGCGLMAGLFFAFSVSVMKALARLLPAQGIAAMQSINVAIINPLFLAVFFGTATACVLVMIAALSRWHDPGAVYLLIGGALYLVGTFLVTMVFNVPKNRALASVAPANAGSTSLWTDYLSKWTAWNHVRTTAALAAAAFLTIAIGHRSTMVKQEQARRASIPTMPTAEQSAMKGEDSLRALQAARHISVSINRPPLDVYDFVSIQRTSRNGRRCWASR